MAYFKRDLIGFREPFLTFLLDRILETEGQLFTKCSVNDERAFCWDQKLRAWVASTARKSGWNHPANAAGNSKGNPKAWKDWCVSWVPPSPPRSSIFMNCSQGLWLEVTLLCKLTSSQTFSNSNEYTRVTSPESTAHLGSSDVNSWS